MSMRESSCAEGAKQNSAKKLPDVAHRSQKPTISTNPSSVDNSSEHNVDGKQKQESTPEKKASSSPTSRKPRQRPSSRGGSPQKKMSSSLSAADKLKDLTDQLHKLRRQREETHTAQSRGRLRGPKTDYSKRPVRKLNHPKLEYIYGEIVYSPYLVPAKKDYPKDVYTMSEKLKEMKRTGYNFETADKSTHPFNVKKVKNEFIREVINWEPTFGASHRESLVEMYLEKNTTLDGSLSIDLSNVDEVNGASLRTNASLSLVSAGARGGPVKFIKSLGKLKSGSKTPSNKPMSDMQRDPLLDTAATTVTSVSNEYENENEFEEGSQTTEDAEREGEKDEHIERMSKLDASEKNGEKMVRDGGEVVDGKAVTAVAEESPPPPLSVANQVADPVSVAASCFRYGTLEVNNIFCANLMNGETMWLDQNDPLVEVTFGSQKEISKHVSGSGDSVSQSSLNFVFDVDEQSIASTMVHIRLADHINIADNSEIGCCEIEVSSLVDSVNTPVTMTRALYSIQNGKEKRGTVSATFVLKPSSPTPATSEDGTVATAMAHRVSAVESIGSGPACADEEGGDAPDSGSAQVGTQLEEATDTQSVVKEAAVMRPQKHPPIETAAVTPPVCVDSVPLDSGTPHDDEELPCAATTVSSEVAASSLSETSVNDAADDVFVASQDENKVAGGQSSSVDPVHAVAEGDSLAPDQSESSEGAPADADAAARTTAVNTRVDYTDSAALNSDEADSGSSRVSFKNQVSFIAPMQRMSSSVSAEPDSSTAEASVSPVLVSSEEPSSAVAAGAFKEKEVETLSSDRDSNIDQEAQSQNQGNGGVDVIHAHEMVYLAPPAEIPAPSAHTDGDGRAEGTASASAAARCPQQAPFSGTDRGREEPAVVRVVDLPRPESPAPTAESDGAAEDAAVQQQREEKEEEKEKEGNQVPRRSGGVSPPSSLSAVEKTEKVLRQAAEVSAVEGQQLDTTRRDEKVMQQVALAQSQSQYMDSLLQRHDEEDEQLVRHGVDGDADTVQDLES